MFLPRLGCVERHGRLQPPAMPFNHAARERQRQAHAAAFLEERSGFPVVCSLYAVLRGDDHNRRRAPVDLFDPALGDDRARSWLFSQDRSKNRVECVPEPLAVT